jgi:imidazolonepropionase-like amidohydrolase
MELGLDLPTVLRAATATGADICRQPAGRIEVGSRADLAMYDHLPKTVAHLLAPQLVCVAGRVTATDGLRDWTRSATTEVHPDQRGAVS